MRDSEREKGRKEGPLQEGQKAFSLSHHSNIPVRRVGRVRFAGLLIRVETARIVILQFGVAALQGA